MDRRWPPGPHRELVHCPITALGFLRRAGNGALYILSGEDTHLKIYDAKTQRLCASVHVFKAQPVQGLCLGEATDVLVWGGPSVTVLPRATLTGLIDVEGQGEGAEHAVPDRLVLQAPDWIYHGAISPHQPGLAAVVTAHNEVLPLHARGPGEHGGRGWRFGRLRSPPSRPILYSAQVRWVSGEEVLVAAGTVFGEIIVWKCKATTDDGGACQDGLQILNVFTGHEGSIFGVDMSPELVVNPHARDRSRLLASCSDDRTIRIWHISGTGSRAGEIPAGRSFTEARETGFGDKATTAEPEAVVSHDSSNPLAMAMGHVSRIWDVRFCPESVGSSSSQGTARSLALYSFGEDATAQRWRLDLDNNGPGAQDAAGNQGLAATLSHEAVFHNHVGKHIWSSALLHPTPSSLDKTLLATGGSDGKILLIEEGPARHQQEPSNSVLDVDVPSLTSTPPAGKTSSNQELDSQTAGKGPADGEPLHMYGLPSAKSIIATTASGRVLTGCLNASGVSWNEAPVPQPIRDDLRKYQIVRSAGPDVTLFGSPSGQLYIYGNGTIRPVVKLPRKIADIFILPLEAFQGLEFWAAASGQLPIIVTTVGSPEVRLMLLDPATDNIILGDILIELEKGSIPTAAGCCQDLIIFGSRIGTLSLYKFDKSKGRFGRAAHLSRPGSKDAVSSIISVPGKAGQPSPYFLTTSRDGRYRIYETTTRIYPSDDALTVHLRHEAVPPLGPMIECAFFTTANSMAADPQPQLILCGFRSKDFVVWNETLQEELANVECGGAHRAFTYYVDPASPSKLSLVWTKASRTRVFSQDSAPQRPLKPGGHGREIKAAAAQGEYFATGAEDTNIRIWRHGGGDAGRGLRCLAVVERHTTGIQCLKWAGPRHLVSSSGNEELFVWRVARLEHSAYEAVMVVCEGLYPDKTRDGDLRITSFDVQVLHPDEGGGEEAICLSLVLSNSTLKTYRYSRGEGFTLLARGSYTGACLLQIRHLMIQQERDRHWALHMLTASTDGHLALWRTRSAKTTPSPTTPAEYELVEAQRLHQNSVKAIDVREIAAATFPSSCAVVTGGDDNAMGHVRLDWTGGRFRIGARSLVNGAHAAAITGLCIVALESDDGIDSYRMKICTASNDQRVKSWDVAAGPGGAVSKVCLVGDRYSAIADCGDVEQLGEGRIVVAGVGMEVWTV